VRKVQCHECGKSYNYDIDDFCPRCGAFTQPQQTHRIGADGSVVRIDGLNEQYHQKSFVHKELHEENRERKGTPLSQGIKRAAPTIGQKKAVAMQTQKSVKRGAASMPERKQKSALAGIVLMVIILNLLVRFFSLLF